MPSGIYHTQKNNMNTSLSPLSHTYSRSSFNSDAATFHSANFEMEQTTASTKTTTARKDPFHNLEAAQMERSDSGYATGNTTGRRSTSNERRSTSTSSSRRPRQSTSSNRPVRPKNRRAPKSTPSSTTHRPTRPGIQSRYTIPRPVDHQFFQFPSLPPSSTSADDATLSSRPTSHTASLSQAPEQEALSRPQPPATAPIYWTSPATRRLEYAAIDAASRGLKGFLVRLVPDCILPCEFRSDRRSRFHNGEAGDADDAGSVRRYRLCLDDDSGLKPQKKPEVREMEETRPGLVKRITSFGRK